MAAPNWPFSLPQEVLQDGWQQQRNVFVTKFEPEIGDSIDRSRTSATFDNVTARMILTATQKAILEQFFAVDTKDGTLSFYAPKPDGTGDLARVKFASAPRFAAAAHLFLADMELKVYSHG